MTAEQILKPMRRIEMVLPPATMDQITQKLDALGVTGFTVIHDVSGRGERGLHTGIGLGAFRYTYLLLVCEPAQVEPVTAVVQPYLKRFGGICLVSDVQWVLR